MRMPYGPWRPDVGGPNSGFATTADSVLPQAAANGIGYGPMRSLVTATGAEALSGAPRGMITAVKADGSYVVIAATASTIELMDSAYQWGDIETGRTVTSGDDVSFAQFGKYILSTDTTSGLKAYDVDGGGANTAVSAITSARCVFTCNNVVFIGATASNNRRMQSSAIGDYTNWTTDGATGVTFPDGGAIVGGRDLKNGAAILFQESAIRLIQFGSGPGLYSIVKLADGRGAVSDRSIVAFDGMAFYLATDGFYKATAAGTEPIGAEKVNRWLAGQISASDYESVYGAIDPFEKVVWWRISATALLGYDWQLNEFFTATVTTSALSRLATASVTIDSLSGTIDALDVTIDSRLLAGGALLFGALDGAYKFATFSGTSLQATLETCMIAVPNTVMVNRCTPDSDSANSTITLSIADNRYTTPTPKTAQGRTSSGRVGLRGTGKVFLLKEIIPAADDWSYATGIEDIELATGGVQ